MGRRGRFLLTGLVVVGVGIIAVAAASSSGRVVRERTAGSPVFVPCILDGRVLSRPAAITFRCGQWHFYFTDLTWQSWLANSARATGLVHANLCAPPQGCAGGHYRTFHARLLLSRPTTCDRHRQYATNFPWRFRPHFTSLTWTFVGSRPAKWHRNLSMSFFTC
jgi:hypothetical protein